MADITLKSSTTPFSVVIRPLGATIVSIFTPDREGVIRDVVHGFQTAQEQRNIKVYTSQLHYLQCKDQQDHQYVGTVGRVANRIANGEFQLNGRKYQLPINKPPNSIHGGIVGFDSKEWAVVSKTNSSVKLQCYSDAGEEKFPLPLIASITYTIQNSTLEIDYEAHIPTEEPEVTSADETETIVNLTSHTFFNLTGMRNPSILAHTAQFPSARGHFVLNYVQIPTGEIALTGSIPEMDFTVAKAFGAEIEKLAQWRGYDHFYITKDLAIDSNVILRAAIVECAESGIVLEMHTDAVGFQLYTGNWLNATIPTKIKSQPAGFYGPHSAFCLETSAPPDAVNSLDPNVRKTVVLKKGGDPWQQRTEYRFRLVSAEE
ncbi:hypothetical protein HK100_012474 [Physocladia obscura]|uniref:Aldose 1-epimerase n=1 Tax=Physocladia obscura TaxID=109957 RepID=A0AAD5XHL5_9FUNG|nr:hypothetical protein HK100_012474 [Physocladia obscura]